jgi:hypothetical protein
MYSIQDNLTQTKQDQMKGAFNSNTVGVVYLLSCLKCDKQYIGQTGRKFGDRLKEHLYCLRKQKETMGEHHSSRSPD